MRINTYDIDGVIYMGRALDGLYPNPNDFIITGRSYEEADETLHMLRARGINNIVFFNPLMFDEKTRETSGQHTAQIISELIEEACDIGIQFEDDEVQIAEIQKIHPTLAVVHVKSDLVEKKNVRHTW